LREMVPLADSTIYEMEQRGEFPRRFALSPRCVVWDFAEVEAWLAARRSAPIARAQSPDIRQRRSRPVRSPGPVQTTVHRRRDEHRHALLASNPSIDNEDDPGAPAGALSETNLSILRLLGRVRK